MTSIEENILERLTKIERLLQSRPASKRTWVKISVITKLTNWSKEDMRKARENGLIKFRHENGGFSYLLESIDEKFIKKATL